MAEKTLALVLAKLGRSAAAPNGRGTWLYGAAAHNRLLCLAGSAACLAGYRVRHALRALPAVPDPVAAFADRYGLP